MSPASKGRPAAADERDSGRTGNTERRQRVIDEVKRGIVLGEIVQGQRVVESDLTSRLAVSRPTAREALNQLASDGYLVQEAYRGLRVTEVDPARLLEFSRLRMSLDMQAATMIIEDTTGESRRRLKEVWARYERAGADEDPLVQHDEHLAFHRGYWEASGNYFLPKLWPVVEAEMTLSLAFDQIHRHDAVRALRVHGAIVEATLIGDRVAVHEAMEEHTMASAREISQVLHARGGVAG